MGEIRECVCPSCGRRYARDLDAAIPSQPAVFGRIIRYCDDCWAIPASHRERVMAIWAKRVSGAELTRQQQAFIRRHPEYKEYAE